MLAFVLVVTFVEIKSKKQTEIFVNFGCDTSSAIYKIEILETPCVFNIKGFMRCILVRLCGTVVH